MPYRLLFTKYLLLLLQYWYSNYIYHILQIPLLNNKFLPDYVITVKCTSFSSHVHDWTTSDLLIHRCDTLIVIILHSKSDYRIGFIQAEKYADICTKIKLLYGPLIVGSLCMLIRHAHTFRK